tara:strand:+ start:4165 stop:4971 length:807 start_codon:yes stop_codon:yes gene_type:complete
MAKTGRVVSLKIVADRLMQNPALKDISWEFMVDKAVEVMSLLDAPALYVSKEEQVSIINHKGKIPADVMHVSQVFKVSSVLTGGASSTGLDNAYSTSGATAGTSLTSNSGYTLIPLRSGTDSLHDHYGKYKSASAGVNGGETYSMNNNNIFTNFETGTVVIVYRAIATDEECYPLVTNNASLLRCIESYIKYRWFDILNDMDQISGQKLNKAEVDYLANVAQADANLKLPSDDEMETLVNQITQLIPSRTQFQDRFAFLGAQEHLRIH